jgi:copper resistance protein B
MHSLPSFLAVSLMAVSPLLAQHAGHSSGGAPGVDAPAAPVAGQPPHLTQGWAPPVEDRMRFNYVLIDRLEFSSGDAADALSVDAEGWYGGDRNKFWWKAEGASRLSGRAEGEGEVQALYSRLVAPFWDFQTGLRHDRTWGTGSNRDRTFAVFGFEGLAPYWFELEPALFVSEHGDISARLAATYDVLLTQRLILQPRLDLNAALQDAPKFGVGSGLNNVEAGLRLRYEIRREFAPYVGVTWIRQLGQTADLSRAAGEPVDDLRFVLGLRLWW